MALWLQHSEVVGDGEILLWFGRNSIDPKRLCHYESTKIGCYFEAVWHAD